MRVVLPRYQERAQEWLKRYEHVSLINGLVYDRSEEQAAVTAFSEALERLVRGHQTTGAVEVPGMRPSVRALLEKSADFKERLRQAAIVI